MLNQTWEFKQLIVTVTQFKSVESVLKQLAPFGPFEPTSAYNDTSRGAIIFTGPGRMLLQFHKEDWGGSFTWDANHHVES